MHKHVQVAELSRANWEVLNSLERIASKLLKLVAKKPVETAPRRVHSPGRALRKSVLHSAAGAEAAAEPQTFATATAATAHARALLLTRHQLALLRAVLHALHLTLPLSLSPNPSPNPDPDPDPNPDPNPDPDPDPDPDH